MRGEGGRGGKSNFFVGDVLSKPSNPDAIFRPKTAIFYIL